MSDIPDALDLLAIARETLLSDLLPGLPRERRYIGLMVANAVAIAEREQSLAARTDQRERAALRQRLNEVSAAASDAAPALAELRRAMRMAIREGRFDDAPHAAALTNDLLEVAAERVAVSNPKALA